jgi:hypothetical protein
MNFDEMFGGLGKSPEMMKEYQAIVKKGKREARKSEREFRKDLRQAEARFLIKVSVLEREIEKDVKDLEERYN